MEEGGQIETLAPIWCYFIYILLLTDVIRDEILPDDRWTDSSYIPRFSGGKSGLERI